MSLKNLAKLISETVKEKSVEEEFLFQLNETISRLDAENPRKPSQSYKPSSLGGCMRNMYYQVIGAEQDPNQKREASNVGITESGSDRHERIQKAVSEMKRVGYDFEWIDVADYLEKWPQDGTVVVERQGMETKLKNTILNLSFLCDGIVRFNGEYYVLEIKTEASFKFNGRSEAVDKHKYQATAYSVALGIDKIIFIYENRDFCSKKSFLYEVTQNDKEERVIHRIATCDSYVERGVVPPKTTVQSECKYCSYKERCAKDGETIEED
jgi:CRISPR/Cas system-associated exonuclease Cas4 (RecB family)